MLFQLSVGHQVVTLSSRSGKVTAKTRKIMPPRDSPFVCLKEIVAVPSLVRQLPPPVKKIIGDLANENRVLIGLDLLPAAR
jgi:hypothetical protein